MEAVFIKRDRKQVTEPVYNSTFETVANRARELGARLWVLKNDWHQVVGTGKVV
jgi:hypothetical protein